MVYKKYIKRGNKVFGPYYYESYREGDKVKTRFISGPAKKDKLEKTKKLPYKISHKVLHKSSYKKLFLILSFIIFLFLLIGNINYYRTGKVIYEEIINLTNIEIAEKIASNELVSNVDVRKDIDLEIKQLAPDKNKIMEFDVPEGEIELDFELLDYKEFLEKQEEKTIKAENFNINIRESAEKYKWGYQIRLSDLNFMAKINIKSDENIVVINDQILRIGNNYLSFADLVEQGYVVGMKPVVLHEIGLPKENITEVNKTGIEGSPDYIGGSPDYVGGSPDYVGGSGDGASPPLQSPSDGDGSPEEPSPQPPSDGSPDYVSGSAIHPVSGFFIEGIKRISGFFVNGFKGIIGFSGFTVQEEKSVSVYVEKSFTNIKGVGELIELDPILLRIVTYKEAEPSIEFPKLKKVLNCTSNWVCGDWSESECKIILNYESIAEGKVFLKGEQTRICQDKNKCFFDKAEKEECDTKIPVIVKKVKKCFKDYIEIYNEQGVLISRLELVKGTYKKLNIQMLIAGEYCPYCFDKEKNYDEDDVDCQYEGNSCPICREEIPVEQAYPLILIILMILILLCFLMIVWYLYLQKKSLKRRKEIARKTKKLLIARKLRKKRIKKLKKQRREIKKTKKLSFVEKREIARDFEVFERGVERLKEIEKELNSLDTSGYEKEADSIRSKIKNVSAIPQIEKELIALKKKLGYKTDY